MSTFKKIFASIASAGSAIFAWVSLAAAQSTIPTGLSGAQSSLASVGSAGGFNTTNETSLPALIGSIINVALGLLGIIFVVLIVVAGFIYMTAAGDTDKVKKATGIIRTGVIGLIITVAAYAISSFVVSALVTATT